MNQTIQIILEILKICVPSLIVFLTAYYMLKKFLNSQLQHQQFKYKSEHGKYTIRIKLQAYERLTLFCERIDTGNLLLRIRTNQMTGLELRNALMIAVQTEYEHNLVQQIYVSDNLWKIIQLTKDYVLKLISDNYEDQMKLSDSKELADKIMTAYQSLDINPVERALKAIKTETGLIIS